MLAFIDGPQMIVVGLVMLLLFGYRLPHVMQSLGRGMEEFSGLPRREQQTRPSWLTANTPLINLVLLGLIVAVLAAATVYWALLKS